MKIKNLKLYREMKELTVIANRGVKMALADKARKKIPVVFSVMNKIYYRMPDGTITTKSPFKKKK
jgi:hypothetical protein